MDEPVHKLRSKWIQCPICQKPTKTRIFSTSILLHFPLYCSRCKKEIVINVVDNKMIIETMQ